MKFKVLQEVVNKRYNVYLTLYWWHGQTTNKLIDDLNNHIVDKDGKYSVDYKYELIDRELIDEFDRYDMKYKIGDSMWYNDNEYKIKDVIDSGSEGIRVYLDKQNIVKEIGKKEADELLEEIKIKQKDLINAIKESELRYKEKEKMNIENQYNQIKTKNFMQKIKDLFKGDKK